MSHRMIANREQKKGQWSHSIHCYNGEYIITICTYQTIEFTWEKPILRCSLWEIMLIGWDIHEGCE